MLKLCCKDNKKSAFQCFLSRFLSNFAVKILFFTLVMKKEWQHLIEDVEKKIGDGVHLRKDIGKLRKIFAEHHFHLHDLSPQAKDRLALLAGFQSWKDFDEALHGDADGEVNYEG